MVKTEIYINRQGNTVEVVRRMDGTVQSVEVSGTGSHRAFMAQMKAAKKKAGSQRERTRHGYAG